MSGLLTLADTRILEIKFPLWVGKVSSSAGKAAVQRNFLLKDCLLPHC